MKLFRTPLVVVGLASTAMGWYPPPPASAWPATHPTPPEATGTDTLGSRSNYTNREVLVADWSRYLYQHATVAVLDAMMLGAQ
jgi:hypothetical protein